MQKKYDDAETKGRIIFKKLFANFFKTIEFSADKFCFWDVSGETFTRKKKVTEIKNRPKYLFENYSGSTIIEKHKVTEFKKLQLTHDDYHLHYMCMYKDHWVSYNLTERFKRGSEDLTIHNRSLPNSSVCNKGYRDKEVCYLKFDLKYGDKYGNYGTL